MYIRDDVSTQNSESEVAPRRVHVYVSDLDFAFRALSNSYNFFFHKRGELLFKWLHNLSLNTFTRDVTFGNLNVVRVFFDTFSYLNTPFYHQFAQTYQGRDWYIDYATELPKIKYAILEQEVTWYTENLPKLSEIAQNEKRPPFIKAIADQNPIEAHHTHLVINHALEQLEKMAPKMKEAPSLERLQNFQKDVERYVWCLTGMAPLLPIEEQNPFQEGGLYQRLQKARGEIQEVESVRHQHH